MLKKICVLILFLFMMSSCVYGASLPGNYDPYHLYPIYNYDDNDDRDWETIYRLYGKERSDLGFFYQLRDITGADNDNTVAGPQWFATVYENYFHYFYYVPDDDNNNDFTITFPYLRTLGGELHDGKRINTGEYSDVPLTVLADLIDDFNYVLASEPEPYDTWINRGIINPNYYDVYPDPLESLCLVIPENQSVTFNINFANAYARHFPFWYGWGLANDPNKAHWWEDYDSTYTYSSINEPVFCVIDTTANTVYQRKVTNGVKTYPLTYNMTASNDKTLINDTSGNTIYTVSGDKVYNSSGNIEYTFANDIVYKANGDIAYTIEYGDNNINTDIRYLCDLRTAAEQIEVALDDSYQYSVNVTPSQEANINPGEYLNAKITLNTSNAAYGSTLGYITFKQRATFGPGYSNYREASPIPVVVANVSNGNASGNPLLFDVLIKDGSDNIVKRVKFTWDVQDDKTVDIGKFLPENNTNLTYPLEIRITNRTGTRYMRYRYDQLNDDNINPAYWKYDLIPDLYGTLPAKFFLEAQSQIAPGLVTVYDKRSIDVTKDMSELFRLYEYSSTTTPLNPKGLTLQYRSIKNMTFNPSVLKTYYSGSTEGARLQTFSMPFVDQVQNDDNTAYELKNFLIGKDPAMISASDAADVAPGNFSDAPSAAIAPFAIDKDAVPALTAEIKTASDDEAAKIALMPVSIRIIIPRDRNTLMRNNWDKLEKAADSGELLSIFSSFAAIWVRSDATDVKDTNLITAINNTAIRGYDSENIKAADCINAFTESDDLYIDFIAILADGHTIRDNGRTAYVGVFKDDSEPYVIIGDGEEGDGWHLKFYVTANNNTSNPDANLPNDDDNEDEKKSTTSDDQNLPSSGGSSGGGGGCNTLTLGFGLLLACTLCFAKRKI